MTSAKLNPVTTPSARRESFLPFARPDLTEGEIDAVVRVPRSGWITTGPEVQAFEREFAQYVGVPHAGLATEAGRRNGLELRRT